MPLEKCSANNTTGYRWGKQGKCYTGKDAKLKALKQGYAEDPKHFKEEVSKSDIEVSAKEIMEVELADFFKKENVDNSEN